MNIAATARFAIWFDVSAMKHNTRTLSESQKEFVKAFETLCSRRQAWQVWSDFVDVSAITISNSIDQDPQKTKEREKRFSEIMDVYDEQEKSKLAELLSITVIALDEDQDQDFLGEMFMVLELGSNWHGQFFTPYNVCRMCAEISIDAAVEYAAKHGYVSVNDPACGAGALLISARNLFQQRGIGGEQAFFIAQDIDHVAGMMCYIQLSLLGCAGYVVIADTLANPVVGRRAILPEFKKDQDAWVMPMTYSDVWQTRIILAWIGSGRSRIPIDDAPEVPQDNQQKADDAKEPAEKVEVIETEAGQLMLF